MDIFENKNDKKVETPDVKDNPVLKRVDKKNKLKLGRVKKLHKNTECLFFHTKNGCKKGNKCPYKEKERREKEGREKKEKEEKERREIEEKERREIEEREKKEKEERERRENEEKERREIEERERREIEFMENESLEFEEERKNIQIENVRGIEEVFDVKVDNPEIKRVDKKNELKQGRVKKLHKNTECRFFHTKNGCKKGNKCPYKHIPKSAMPVPPGFKKVGTLNKKTRNSKTEPKKVLPLKKEKKGICSKHLKNKCMKERSCPLIHDTCTIPCKFGNHCKTNMCKFEHKVWHHNHNFVRIEFDSQEGKKSIDTKISRLSTVFHTKPCSFKGDSKFRNTEKKTNFAFSLSSDKAANDLKNYFVNTIEKNNSRKNMCFIFSKTEFLENVKKAESKESPKSENKNPFPILINKNGPQKVDFEKAIEKLQRFKYFLKVCDSEKKGKNKGWVKVLFEKMTTEIASIFYNPQVKTRVNHPSFHKCHIQLVNSKLQCAKYGMIGHEIVHCSVGLNEIVQDHGPNMCSKSTMVKNSKIYNPKTFRKSCISVADQAGTLHIHWKSNNKTSLSIPKIENNKKVNQKPIEYKPQINLLKKAEDLDANSHLTKFMDCVKKDSTLSTMGASRWEGLFNQYSIGAKKPDRKVENTEVENLEIYHSI